MSTFLRSNFVRPVLGGLAAVLLLGGATSGLQTAAAAPAGPAPSAASLGGKLEGPLAVNIRPDGAGRAVVIVTGRPAVAQVAVEITGTGGASGTGSTTQALGSAGDLTIPVSYTATGDVGSIVATVRGSNAAGQVLAERSDVLYVQDSHGELIASDQGTLDLALQDLRHGHDAGVLDDAAYQAATEAVLSGGAAENTSVKPSTGRTTNGVRAAVTTTGTIRWTDSVGGIHPVRGALVEVRDAESSGSTLLASVTTNDAGTYAATFDNTDGPGLAGQDVFVVVLAQGAGFHIDSLAGQVQRIGSATQIDVADGATVSIDLTANGVDDNNTAFSIQDALVSVTRYEKHAEGSALPTLQVVFPTDAETSLFDGTDLQILQLDRFDPDVIGHEFGHYVQQSLAITENPGGSHTVGDNAAETHGKADGLRLAWGEGWPTYFAVTAQKQQNTAAQHIPRSGDLSYTDTEDADLSYSLETDAGAPDVGEDDELSNQRILFDLFDAGRDVGDTRGVALGDQALWNLVTNSHSVTLNKFYGNLAKAKTLKQLGDYGCIFSAHKVAPAITSPASGKAPAAAPTITWARNGLGPSFRNDRFTVKFYDPATNKVLLASPLVNAASFKPTAAQWKAVLAHTGARIDVIVAGRNSVGASNAYTSCNIQLTH
ncbi:hypothetical protein BH10ACT1_BH10ACT1_17970 [soil metagenome]